jgi:CubicO group peptidase (beta-lactamase class C family)
VADLRQEKGDLQKMTHGIDSISSNKLMGMHSLLVFRHGKLLLEEYFNGASDKTDHPLFSCTKSVFSTVFGIAQDQGLLNVEQKLYDLYPDQKGKTGWDPRKADITVGNMLSMTSGLDCNDVGVGDANCGSQMGRSPDWLGFIFGLPMAHAPGEVWTYNGSSLSLLSNFIALKGGMSFPEFAKKNLLDPLGIAGGEWVAGPSGVNRVDYGLAWKARDMGKLGQLYLNKGLWKGKRVLSEAWVKDATALHAKKGTSFGHSYGYLWHLKDMQYKKTVQVFFANGYKGQAIFVSPEADLVCVMTADSPDDAIYTKEEQLFEDNILAAFP